MGLFANFPFALAPGMGLNAYFIFGTLMMTGARELDWSRMEDAIPAFLTVVTMPFTYSIAHGITVGIVSFVAMRLVTGRRDEIHPLMGGLATLLVGYYAYPVLA